jgi:hypothetical protein
MISGNHTAILSNHTLQWSNHRPESRNHKRKLPNHKRPIQRADSCNTLILCNSCKFEPVRAVEQEISRRILLGRIRILSDKMADGVPHRCLVVGGVVCIG